MKKFKKSDLRLEREVITSLSENDLNGFKGGGEISDGSPVCIGITRNPLCNPSGIKCASTPCYSNDGKACYSDVDRTCRTQQCVESVDLCAETGAKCVVTADICQVTFANC